jgi:quercetin dioxygenase-like cupin family protein
MESNSIETHGGDSGADVKPSVRETKSGPITNLNVAGNVSILHCDAGSKRSSHHHKSDWHYLFVVRGVMHYRERPVGSTERPELKIYYPGDMVFTGPNVEHWTEFPIQTTLVSVSRLHRTHEAHEADLVRVEWFE